MNLFTDRQMEILILRRDGLSIKEIAEKLGSDFASIRTSEKTARAKILKMKETIKFLEENGISY